MSEKSGIFELIKILTTKTRFTKMEKKQVKTFALVMSLYFIAETILFILG